MKKRLISLLLVLVMLAGFVPLGALADNAPAVVVQGSCGATSNDDVNYVLTNDGVLTISGTGATANYNPGSAPWYSNRTLVTDLVVGEGVTALGDRNLYFHPNLASVSLPGTLTAIGEQEFQSCAKLTSVVIPEGVTSLGAQAFNNCTGLTAVDLPASLTTVGADAFKGADGITAVGYGGSELAWVALSAGISQLQDALVTCRGGKAVSIAVTGQKTEYALYEHLTLAGASVTVTLDNGQSGQLDPRYAAITGDTSVPGETTATVSFFDASTQFTVTVSDQIGLVASGTYGAAGNEENITWRLTTDGRIVLSGTGAMFDLPDNGRSPWWPYAEYVNEAVIEEGITTIGKSAFDGYKALTSVSIPESVTTIGFGAFVLTGLTTVTLPKNVTSVGSQCFDYCYDLTTMVYDAQADLGLAGTGTYVNNISHLILGPNCTVWPGRLLNKLRNTLEILEIDENNTYFHVVDDVVYVDEGKTLLAVLPTFSGVLNVPEGVTKIGEAAAQNRTAITGLTLPSTLTSIEGSAFDGCSNLAGQLELPDGLIKLGTGSFAGTAITGTVTIPASVSNLGAAFQQCRQLEAAIFPGSREEIPNSFFNGCTSLRSVTLPEGLAAIGTQAFVSCKALNSLDWPDTLESIGREAFKGAGLTSVTLPDSVTELDTYAFNSCTGLSYLDLGAGVTGIPTGLTAGCSALVDFIVPVSVASYNDSHAGCSQLRRILYRGTEEQWNAIEMSTTIQRVLATKEIIFNYDPHASPLGVTVTQQPAGASYAWGAIAAPLEVRAEAEEGVTLSYVWFVNTANSTQGGTALDYAVHLADGSRAPVYYSDPGTYYYYCAITAVKDSTITTVYSDIVPIEITGTAGVIDLTGSGTEGSPYQVKSTEDLVKVSGYTLAGHDFQNEHIKLMNSVTLPAGWTPIGLVDGNYNASSNGAAGGVWRLFRGAIDGGNNTVTVPEGGRPLIGAVGGGAGVKDLKVYGKKIAGAGLIDLLPIMGTGRVYVDNITILSGTSTRDSGITNGGGRSSFDIWITNCTVESGVTIGCDRNRSAVGSIIGNLCGMVDNCVSSADVYGVNHVGGLVGVKGQSMAAFQVINSQFHGTVTATGRNAGGIVASGYYSTSAPNTAGVIIQNCSCDGTVKGVRAVGGILGAEPGLDQAWDNGICAIQNNTFTGTVTGDVQVGSIVGFLRSMNRYVYVDGNTGAAPAIGFVTHIDTSAVAFGMHDGTFYYNTANFSNYTKEEWDQIYAAVDADWTPGAQYADDWAGQDVRWHNSSIARANHNRTDNPLNCDAAIVAIDVTTMPDKTEYLVGEAFDGTGMVVTLTQPDGTSRTLSSEEYSVSFDSSRVGTAAVTITYGTAVASFTVTVRAPEGQEITVKLTVLGDTHHDMAEGDTGHGLWVGGLTEWLPETGYTVSANASVYDLIEQAFDADPALTMYARWTDSYGSYYIYAVDYNGLTLNEKDNWKNSGWMVTVNGVHVQVGVSNMTLADGDEVILHWCDDFYIDEAEGAHQAFLAAKPQVTAANDKDGKIYLTWEDVTGAVAYEIYCSEAEDSEYTLLDTVDDTEYTKGGSMGKAYWFKVVAVNAAGEKSHESDPVKKFRVPAQVTSLKATSKSKQVTLKWKKVSGAKKYEIYMSKNGKTGWKKVGTASTNKFVYKKGKVGQKLYFRVRAVSSNGKKGEYSKNVSIKVKK